MYVCMYVFTFYAILKIKFMMKHWLTNTRWIEIQKKSGPVRELNPGPLDVRSRTLPQRHTGSQQSQTHRKLVSYFQRYKQLKDLHRKQENSSFVHMFGYHKELIFAISNLITLHTRVPILWDHKIHHRMCNFRLLQDYKPRHIQCQILPQQ